MRFVTSPRLWLFATLVATVLHLGNSAMAAREAAPYSCCGYPGCVVLVTTQACPHGDMPCPDPTPICCMDACNDPGEGQ